MWSFLNSWHAVIICCYLNHQFLCEKSTFLLTHMGWPTFQWCTDSVVTGLYCVISQTSWHLITDCSNKALLSFIVARQKIAKKKNKTCEMAVQYSAMSLVVEDGFLNQQDINIDLGSAKPRHKHDLKVVQLWKKLQFTALSLEGHNIYFLSSRTAEDGTKCLVFPLRVSIYAWGPARSIPCCCSWALSRLFSCLSSSTCWRSMSLSMFSCSLSLISCAILALCDRNSLM